MKLKLQKGFLETFIVFILSPILSIPFVFLQGKRKDNSIIFLISVFFGLLSFLYIPSLSNDKARYFERFEQFKDYNYSQFLEYLVSVKRPDFVFDHLIFIFSSLGFNIQYLFLLISTLTVYSIFRFLQKILSLEIGKTYNFTIITILIVIFSLSLSGIFSGVRFYFAGSLFIWSIIYFFYEKRLKKAIIFLSITILTHFSFAFFIPCLILIAFFPKNFNPKILLSISLLFLILPKDYLSNILGFLQMPESYSNKAELYLQYENNASDSSIILSFIRNLWLYFAYLFLLFTDGKRDPKLYLIVVVLLSIVNITFSIPVVFNRFSLVVKILFLAFMLSRSEFARKYGYIMLFLFFLNFIVDINVLRFNIIASYQLSDMLTLFNILNKKISHYDFLR